MLKPNESIVSKDKILHERLDIIVTQADKNSKDELQQLTEKNIQAEARLLRLVILRDEVNQRIKKSMN
jgi:hypothetical protein